MSGHTQRRIRLGFVALIVVALFLGSLSPLGTPPALAASGPPLSLLQGRFILRGYAYGDTYYIAITASEPDPFPEDVPYSTCASLASTLPQSNWTTSFCPSPISTRWPPRKGASPQRWAVNT